ncbi:MULTISPECIES: glycosyltransferase [Rhodonellum]|nr:MULTISPECIES: glycosyltransferase [Rhodonellum]SDZ06247.1 GalNAc-alpha-(1->4)-GalNAc-alpha-(1->3)-diNAcBac-PP-undecaprenol alpha-1,4-N-acetyl-D-galactosaminyltransferase [Rhodonellum ikkaensis]
MNHICFVIHSLQPGGMERVFSVLLNDFVKREGVKVDLILYGIKRDVFYNIDPSIQIHLPDFPFDPERRGISTVKTVFFLRKKIKALNPEAVLSFGVLWNNLVLLATKGLGIPVFVSDRSQPDKPLSPLQEKLRKYLYPGAYGIIAQTQKAKEVYQKIYRHNNMTVIGNPIVQEMPIDEKRKEILMVARLIQSKHQNELIEIFASLPKNDWELTLVGDDHLKQNNKLAWKKLAEDLGVGNRVNFEGMQKDVEKYYGRASIFAFSSSSEGFPNVIGEAMAAKLPVIAYDCVAGPSDLIENGVNGYLIPLHDKILFAEKLLLLMENEELRNKMGEDAKISIKSFSSKEICNAYFDFMSSVKTNIQEVNKL